MPNSEDNTTALVRCESCTGLGTWNNGEEICEECDGDGEYQVTL